VAVDKIWSKNGIQLGQRAPAIGHAEAAGFYGSIAKLSPNTEAQHFIRKRALEISGAIRQTRALMVEQINSSIPWPFLTVLVFWISMLFVGFGLFARANATVIVALLIALCPKAPRRRVSRQGEDRAPQRSTRRDLPCTESRLESRAQQNPRNRKPQQFSPGSSMRRGMSKSRVFVGANGHVDPA
jgi:hypothetical protein